MTRPPVPETDQDVDASAPSTAANPAQPLPHSPSTPLDSSTLFAEAARQVSAELEGQQAKRDEEVLKRWEESDIGSNSIVGDTLGRTADAIGLGAARAGFETYDFLFGEPAEEDKTDTRRRVEAHDRALKRRSAGYGLASSASQIAVGLIGAGKLMKPLQVGGKVARGVWELGRGALAGSVVIDPHEERLSDLVEEFPILQNPVSAYLQSDPTDTDAEGRFKNALESIGLDLAVVGTIALVAKAIRLGKAGDEAGVRSALDELEAHHRKQEEAFGLPGERHQVDANEVLNDPDMAAAQAKNVEAFGLPTDLAPGKAADDLAVAPAAARGVAPVDPSVPGGPKPQDAPTASPEAPGGIPAGAAPGGEIVQGSKPPVSRIAQPEFDLEALAKSVSDDIDAVSTYGSREAAIEAGHKFSPEARLPWQKLNAPEERRAFVQAVVEQGQRYFDAKKGGDVMSDARVQRVVGQIAEVFNEDPGAVMGIILQAGENAASQSAKLEAGFLLGQKMLQDAHEVQFHIENGMLDEWGGDVVAAQTELKKRLMAGLELTAAANSMLSNAGRSLRRARASFRLRPEDIAEIDNLSLDELSRAVSATRGDPKKLVKTAQPDFLTKITEGATSLLANNLLWLYPTHAINVTTNVMMMVGRPTEKLLGGLVLRNSAARKQALKEYTYLATGLSDAWHTAVEAYKSGDSVLKPHGDEFMESAGAMGRDLRVGWQPATSVGNILGNSLKAMGLVLGQPTRALGMVDEFVKQMRYRTVVQARAAVEATERGLEGEAFRRYVEEKLQTAFDAEGRGIDAAALREAQVATFQTELDYPAWVGAKGGLGGAVRNLRTGLKWPGLILPFVKTPINVLRYATKFTPGLNLLQKEYAMALAGKSGAEAQAHAVGQFALGSLAMGLASVLAAEGRLTGGGPENKDLRKELLDQGWKPYSFVMHNEDGTKTYFPIGRFDPAGFLFGTVADLMDMMVLHPDRAQEAERGIQAVALALSKNLSEKTFLLNVNMALTAATDPGANAERFFGTLAGNLIPASSALRGYVNPDPYLREARSIVDHILKDMPGYSSTLPPQRDAFGEEVWRRRGLTTTQDEDLVEEEHQRIIEETGHGISKPHPVRDDVDLRDVWLEDGGNAYERLQAYSARPSKEGMSLKEAVAKLIRSEGYAKLVDGSAEVPGTKLDAISDVVARYREAGFKRLQRESVIVRQALRKRSMDVRSGLLDKRAERQASPVQDLIDGLRKQ